MRRETKGRGRSGGGEEKRKRREKRRKEGRVKEIEDEE